MLENILIYKETGQITNLKSQIPNKLQIPNSKQNISFFYHHPVYPGDPVVLFNLLTLLRKKLAFESILRNETEREAGGQGLSAEIPAGVAEGYIEDISVRKHSYSCLVAGRSRMDDFQGKL